MRQHPAGRTWTWPSASEVCFRGQSHHSLGDSELRSENIHSLYKNSWRNLCSNNKLTRNNVHSIVETSYPHFDRGPPFQPLLARFILPEARFTFNGRIDDYIILSNDLEFKFSFVRKTFPVCIQLVFNAVLEWIGTISYEMTQSRWLNPVMTSQRTCIRKLYYCFIYTGSWFQFLFTPSNPVSPHLNWFHHHIPPLYTFQLSLIFANN